MVNCWYGTTDSDRDDDIPLANLMKGCRYDNTEEYDRDVLLKGGLKGP